jgi:two-component system, OmpR family, sensor histidine kinase KdpD
MSPLTEDRTVQRGRHVIFLGYAVGVGKTCSMLQEGQRRVRLGEDVVVGLLESHARAAVVGLARGLERLAPLRVGYHGATLDELDVEAALARRPDWLLVDELAHANPPGVACETRWSAVESLLDAGVGVMSTVNVQHVESLNDFVFCVTGQLVRGTVPDRLFADADRIVLVDPPPEELIARVKRGEVLPKDELGRALTHFFQGSSLAALRSEARALAVRHTERRRDIVR